MSSDCEPVPPPYGLTAYLRSVQRRDPAAKSLWEIALLYPGVRALALYRVSNRLWRWNLRFLARLVSEIGRILTGIEIHPGATVGQGFFIDHGFGTVIGETSHIGNNVTLYHDVTLGGTAPYDGEAGKRHPTLKDNVVVGAGAQILGPITIGDCARVGANAVVFKDVPARTTVVGNPARVALPPDVQTPGDAPFAPYGVVRRDLPDPVAKVLEGLMREIETLRAELADAEAAEKGDPTRPVTKPPAKPARADLSSAKRLD